MQETGSEEYKFATLTDRQYEVIDAMAEDPEEWVRQVLAAVERWSQEKVGHQVHLEAFRAKLTEDQRATTGKIDPFLLDKMIKASKHIDHQYAEDFLAGFPVSGVVDAKGTGTITEGGQLTHGRPAHGRVPVLDDLKSRCTEINERTIRMARSRIPRMRQNAKLAGDMWEKICLERSKGRISAPIEIEQFPMGEALLVDTFGVYEQHGIATEETLRVINNFKANEANGYAYMTEKLHYDGFPELKEAAARMSKKQKAGIDECLRMGKADFKSAFKTLPPSKGHRWLCFSLVYNPEKEKLQVVQLFTQAFGSLGGVVAWYRTAKVLQHILLELFHIPVFAYVDDFFWVSVSPSSQRDLAKFILDVFKAVVTRLLGWDLDPEKEDFGSEMVLLGVQIRMGAKSSYWSPSPIKADLWIEEFTQALDKDHMPPGLAAKFAGRVAFLNSKVFNRVGRAMVRPIIWRQHQSVGPFTISKRLRSSLTWFIAALTARFSREIPFQPPPGADSKLVLYSDAEGNGCAGAVAIKGDTRIFMRGQIPARVRRLLQARKTNICAYELLIAVASLVSFCPQLVRDSRVVHYVDSKSAISNILKGASPQPDLNWISGRLWFECGALIANYEVNYVKSSCNLADGPSRGDVSLLLSLGFEEVPFQFPSFRHGLSSWSKHPTESRRMLV